MTILTQKESEFTSFSRLRASMWTRGLARRFCFVQSMNALRFHRAESVTGLKLPGFKLADTGFKLVDMGFKLKLTDG